MKKGLVTVAIAAAIIAGMFFINRSFDPERRTQQQIDAAEAAREDLAKADELEATLAQNNQQQAETPEESTKEEVAVSDQNIITVKLATSKGDVLVELNREWAPLGVQQFLDAIEDGVYNEARFFRVVPNFVVQFGIAGDPRLAAKWENKNIQDEPVKQTNARGTVTFAKSQLPNSRSSQLFINLKDNAFLDGMGFSPIGKVVQGMDVVDQIESKYGEQPNQGAVQSRGNEYLKSQFPDLDYIKEATIEAAAE